MLEIIRFTFSSFWVWVGSLILYPVVFGTIAAVIYGMIECLKPNRTKCDCPCHKQEKPPKTNN
jgi:hypothetical protein